MGEVKVTSVAFKEKGEERRGVNFPEMSTKLITIKRTASTRTRVCQEVTAQHRGGRRRTREGSAQRCKAHEEETFKIKQLRWKTWSRDTWSLPYEAWMLRSKTRNLADPPRKATIQPTEFSSGRNRTRPISAVWGEGRVGLSCDKSLFCYYFFNVFLFFF